MKHKTLPEAILSILLTDKENEDGLTVSEIAHIKYGDGYMKRTAFDLEICIKNAMAKVKELAWEKGFIVYPKRKPTHKNATILSHHIEVWKILDPSNQKLVREFILELEHKKLIGESRTNSYISTVEMGYKVGAIQHEQYVGLTN